ncbi:hypothetical protein BX661DRAFT_183964 [Kickxella alabastrina]|uniref:uncharacterized protein n=1 Tax=Kickxella alabastrina TaxID=61397 RepID=UPI00221EB8EF|nr:uncharacterized protein BX661DRAFT_183964 [Kickxella alabastrina]KAI7826398.1 hypothetical protein BX661DRAFT_183964 [Kickxella alabastrina]
MSGTNTTGGRSKAETAELIALWATHELGFRKASTLPKAFIALYNDLKSASAKEQKVVSEIQGMELENLGCIQAIDELEAKRSATESRIRELRLQILVKQEMAEKVRRLSKRMRILIREMAVASDIRDHLYELIRKAQYSLANEGAGSSSIHEVVADSTLEQRQTMVANVISDIKNLEDIHVRARASLDARKSELVEKLESVVGMLNMDAASDGAEACDFKGAIVHLSQVRGKINVTRNCALWVYEDHNKLELIADQIKEIRSLLLATQNVASKALASFEADVVPAFESLQRSLRYVSTRDAWNSVSLWHLQNIQVDSSNGSGKEYRPADKLVTRSSHTEALRKQLIGDIAHASVGKSGYAHETVVAELAKQVQINGELAVSCHRIEQLHRDSTNKPVHVGEKNLIEAAVDGLCQQAQSKETEAKKSLDIVGASAAMEDVIVQLSETSGRLFTDSFAPWHERSGVSYAEYLKQLKIARASE